MPIINEYENSGIYLEAKTTKNKKNDKQKVPNKVIKHLNLLDKKMDDLYKDIYISRPDNKNNFDSLMDKIDTSIDNLQSKNLSVSGMSELLRRLNRRSNGDNSSNVKSLTSSVEELFGDESLLNSLQLNEDMHRYIKAQNNQYDLICKYLPKLLTALEIKRDNVLCSDNISKKFLNPKSIKTNARELEIFTANTKRLEKEYKISDFFESVYMDVSKYGESFVYIVPYDLAFKRLLKKANYRQNNSRLGQITFSENVSIGNRNILSAESYICVNESFMASDEYKKYITEISKSFITEINNESKFTGHEVKLHFNDTNIIADSVNEYTVIQNKKSLDKFTSLNSKFKDIIHEKSDYDSVFNDTKERNGGKLLSASNDGLILPSELAKDPNKIDKKFTGAVLEKIPRENVIPVYIGKICMGYYYFDFKEDLSACGYCGGHHSTPTVSNQASFAAEMTQDQQDMAIRFIASKISANIDAHFINANKDLKEEIYAILRYNERFDLSRSNDISVSFIPAEDMVHCYSRLDEHTHRGISDLEKSVVPAMLYILLYLTDLISKVSRSSDKRIYYVKQNVETNVARTMMNVVNQIKKGNMGMRQIESMNNMLSIIGKYNDFIIPVGQSGDSPIDFQVMNGQQVDTPTDLMDRMQEEAINSTGVPIELVNSVLQADYATRFSMSNTRFVKSVFAEQSRCERWMSEIYTPLYNYEFNETYNYIEIILPPPTYLTVTNTQQMIDSVNQLTDKINDIELSDKSDEVKAEFKKLHFRHYLSTYVDFDNIKKLIETAEINVKSKEVPQVNDGENSDMSSSSSMGDEEF